MLQPIEARTGLELARQGDLAGLEAHLDAVLGPVQPQRSELITSGPVERAHSRYSRQSGLVHIKMALGIAAASVIGMGSVFGGVKVNERFSEPAPITITVQDTDDVAKLTYRGPNPVHSLRDGGYGVTEFEGQAQALIGKDIYGAEPFSNRPGYDQAVSSDRENTSRVKSYMDWMRQRNPNAVVIIDGTEYLRTPASENDPAVDIAIPRHPKQVAGSYSPPPASTPESTAAQATAEPSATPTLAPRVDNINLGLDRSFVGERRIQNVNQFIDQLKSNKNLRAAFAQAGINPDSVEAQDICRSQYNQLEACAGRFNLTEEQVREAFPIGQKIEMFALQGGKLVKTDVTYEGLKTDYTNKKFAVNEIVYFVVQGDKTTIVRETCVNPALATKTIVRVTATVTPTPPVASPTEVASPTASRTAIATVAIPTGTLVPASPTNTPTATVLPTYVPPPLPPQIELNRAVIHKGVDSNLDGIANGLGDDCTQGFPAEIRYGDPNSTIREFISLRCGFNLGSFLHPEGVPYYVIETDSKGHFLAINDGSGIIGWDDIVRFVNARIIEACYFNPNLLPNVRINSLAHLLQLVSEAERVSGEKYTGSLLDIFAMQEFLRTKTCVVTPPSLTPFLTLTPTVTSTTAIPTETGTPVTSTDTPTPQRPTIVPQTALPTSTMGVPGPTDTPQPVATRFPTSTPNTTSSISQFTVTPRSTIRPGA